VTQEHGQDLRAKRGADNRLDKMDARLDKMEDSLGKIGEKLDILLNR
jgi:archaellum component FlaC